METKSETRSKTIARNTKQLAFWTIGWTLTMAVVAFGPKFIWDYNETISIVAIIGNLVIGIGMIMANISHLKVLDEMQRKVVMDAMAIALGVAVVGGLSYSNLDMANVISSDAEISHLVILIGITYMVGVLVGNFRYK